MSPERYVATVAAAGIATGLALGYLTFVPDEVSKSTVGSTHIPNNLVCAEDEVITFTGIDQLECVHQEVLWSEGVHRCALHGESLWVESSGDPAAFVICNVD